MAGNRTKEQDVNQEIQDFNEPRRERSASERRFYLGPYTFRRRATIPPETVTRYTAAGADGDDANTIVNIEKALLELVEPQAVVTETGEAISTADAWQAMRFQGDENDVVSFEDMMLITNWLIAGVVERPTGQPSDSPDGSPIQETGTTSMPTSPSEAATSTPSTPAGLVMPSMQP